MAYTQKLDSNMLMIKCLKFYLVQYTSACISSKESEPLVFPMYVDVPKLIAKLQLLPF